MGSKARSTFPEPAQARAVSARCRSDGAERGDARRVMEAGAASPVARSAKGCLLPLSGLTPAFGPGGSAWFGVEVLEELRLQEKVAA